MLCFPKLHIHGIVELSYEDCWFRGTRTYWLLTRLILVIAQLVVAPFDAASGIAMSAGSDVQVEHPATLPTLGIFQVLGGTASIPMASHAVPHRCSISAKLIAEVTC